MSIIDYNVNESDQDKKISFGSEDMRIADQMIDYDYDSLDMNNFLFMYKHENISGMKSLPVQQDGINCGVYSLWYLLVASHEDMPIMDLNPERFRDQLLLYSVPSSTSSPK